MPAYRNRKERIQRNCNLPVHVDALLRRRIKSVVEKGAMARLFKGGTSKDLKVELFNRMKPQFIAMQSIEAYDRWLVELIKQDCWRKYSQNGMKQDRWAYFAKLLNIIIYEIISNRELFSEVKYRKVRSWLHVPLDSSVFAGVNVIDSSFLSPKILKGMTESHYMEMQRHLRMLAREKGMPPIWFEDAYTS